MCFFVVEECCDVGGVYGVGVDCCECVVLLDDFFD